MEIKHIVYLCAGENPFTGPSDELIDNLCYIEEEDHINEAQRMEIFRALLNEGYYFGQHEHGQYVVINSEGLKHGFPARPMSELRKDARLPRGQD